MIEKCDISKGEDWFQVDKVGETSFTIEDLTPDRQYKFRIRAVNVAGEGEPSSPSDVITAKEPYDLPGVPNTPTAVNINNTSVMLTWLPPEGNKDSSSRVTSYIIEKCDISKGEDWFQVDKGCETSCAIENLIPDKQYKFRIRAVNVAGVGEPSSPSDVITAKEPYDPPGVPSTPTAVNINKTSVMLTWLPPEGNKDSSSRVTSYFIEECDISQGEYWFQVGKGCETSCAIENLIPDKQYKFRIRAVNVAGKGEPSSPSDVITAKEPYDLPGVPSTPTAVNINKTSVMLTWLPPEGNKDSSSRVTSYVIEKCDISQGEYWFQVGKVGETSFTIEDLIPDRQYKFRIRAVNVAGEGEPSSPSDVITATEAYDPPGVPSTPTAVNINKTSVMLTWLPPEGDKDSSSRVTSYIIEKCDISQGEYWFQVDKVGETSFTIEDLTPDRQYKFRIRAVNVAGEGEPSSPSDVIIAHDLPGVPSTPNAEIINKTSVMLTWSPPEEKEESNSGVTSYIIEKCDISQGEYWFQVDKVGETSFTIEDLIPDRQYKFRIRAVNVAGEGEPSSSSDVITATEPYVYNDGEPQIAATASALVEISEPDQPSAASAAEAAAI
ncbi:myomesin-3-like [Amphiura filiformis]|uniref:myomesin-3-like n=1 Tax=Amphiura filiformis TaxID=82378 RepID=UPI003B21E7A3